MWMVFIRKSNHSLKLKWSILKFPRIEKWYLKKLRYLIGQAAMMWPLHAVYQNWAKGHFNWHVILKPHCIRCSHFKVDDVSALEPSSKPPVRIVEDSVTASATYTMTLVTARMPWRHNVDLLVPAGSSTWLDWIQCGFKMLSCTISILEISWITLYSVKASVFAFSWCIDNGYLNCFWRVSTSTLSINQC
jgi:hypothetical protein